MSILWRNWLSVTVILGLVLAILSTLAILQHNSILAELLKQRLSVVAQSTVGAFRPIVAMGLPLSMLRNAGDLLEQARAEDPNIESIYFTEHDGTVIRATETPHQVDIAPALLKNMQQHPNEHLWSSETETALISAAAILRNNGSVAGWILVVYTKDTFNQITRLLERSITKAGLWIWALVSLLAWILLRIQLRGTVRGFAQVRQLLGQFAQHTPGRPFPEAPKTKDCGLFSDELPELHSKLSMAATQYFLALNSPPDSNYRPSANAPANPQVATVFVKQAPDSSMARAIGRRLAPGIVMLVVAVVLIQGWQIYRQVLGSFEPEQSARLELIGAVANSNIQRAVSAGVPLNSLVGASRYFEELLSNFPEISYFAIAGNQLVVEAGQHARRPTEYWGERRETSTFPIMDNAEQIGRIIVEANPHYFAQQLQNLMLDLVVVMLVAILLAFQVVVVTLSLSMTGPFNRLNHLLSLQSRGDFSCRLGNRRHSALDRAADFLSARADMLCRRSSTAGSRNANTAPKLLQFAYLNDIRLPVFLFGAADALSISFLPVYIHLLDNPLHWINSGVVLSLPLAGYLLAITLGIPLVRSINARWGVRKLLLVSALLTIAANIGLATATTTVELIIFRTLAGLGYAAATLASQDYVLDVVPKEMRGRALGLFTSALFSGIFSGAAAGGLIADRSGPPTVFAIGALIALIAGILTWFLIPRDPRQTTGYSLRLADLLLPLKNSRFTVLIIGIAIPGNVMIQAFIAFLVALQLNALGASAADVASIVMLYFLLLLLVAPVAPRILDDYMHKSTQAMLGAFIAAASLCVAVIWPGYWSMLCAVSGAGIGQGLMRDATVSIAMALAESDLKHLGCDTVLGSLRVVERAGSILGLLGIALLASLRGYPAGIAGIGIWMFAGILVLLLAKLMQKLSY